MSKKVLIIAGPNGAGKTTLANELLENSADLYEFINADEIARGLAPKHPESMALRAGALMIRRLKELLEQNQNFAFETTLAGKNYLNHIKTAKSKGYEVILFFLWLNSSELAVKRVARRVEQGGHNIPKEDIIRRYSRGVKNLLTLYLPLVDLAMVINNSEEDLKHKVIARQGVSKVIDIINPEIWEKLEREAYER